MKDVVKNIVSQYGEEILLESKKFISIFSDIAPTLKREKKLLELALNENIAELFVNCELKNRKTNILRARRKLENYMAEKGIDEVIESLIYALGWESKIVAVKEKESKSTVESNVNRPKVDENLRKNKTGDNAKTNVGEITANQGKENKWQKVAGMSLNDAKWIIGIIAYLAFCVLGSYCFVASESNDFKVMDVIGYLVAALLAHLGLLVRFKLIFVFCFLIIITLWVLYVSGILYWFSGGAINWFY